MGEVYRATDPRLRRDVAIKILPDEVARDATRLARFEREAHLLASLNHPNIAAIHGVEESGGTRCLVLELVEGETLAERIARGPIPVAEAQVLALQIADALEAAHEKGIIHRDLKPANVKVTPEGSAKVLDFGLGKSVDADATPVSASSLSPTLTTPATVDGVILGTAAYMSPEQAKGRGVDRRADIWAFGVVLFEMITGRPCFQRETISETLAAVLMAEPPWGSLPAGLPQRVAALLRRCLERDPRNRLRDIGDARLELQDAIAGRDAAAAGAAAGPPRRAGLAIAAALVAGGLIGALIAGMVITKGAPAGVSRFAVLASGNLEIRRPLISPDGSAIGFAGRDRSAPETSWRLYTRRIDAFTESPVEASEGLAHHGFSPDGRWLAWAAPVSAASSRERLMRAPVDGSAPALAIAELREHVDHVIWMNDAEILTVRNSPPISMTRFSIAGGGTEGPREIRSLNEFVPMSLLPDGRVLGRSWIWSTERGRYDIMVLDAGTAEVSTLLENGDFPRWSPTGHLLFSREDKLLAVRLDENGRISGGPVPIMDGLWREEQWGGGYFSISGEGTLIYVPGPAGPSGRRLVFVSRDGTMEPWSDIRQDFRFYPAVSPDGRRIAVTVTSLEDTLWEIRGSEIERPRVRTIADHPGMDCTFPIWTPDSEWIVYGCRAAGASGGVFMTRFDGSEAERTIIANDAPDVYLEAHSLHPDGSLLLVGRASEGKLEILLVRVPPEAGAKPELTLLLPASAREGKASFSPDGRWIAYDSSEVGRGEVYIRRFRGDSSLGPPIQISDGGSSPLWSPASDGRSLELTYQRPGQLMSVTIVSEPFAVSDPKPLINDAGGMLEFPVPLRDGRFIVIQRGAEENPGREIRVVRNFFEELRQRVP